MKNKEDVKTCVVAFRLTKSDKEAFERYARKLKMSRSELLRAVIQFGDELAALVKEEING